MKRRRVIIGVALTIIATIVIAATQVSIVVIQPIGAIPEGRTVIISRLTNVKFIDSPDAICQRLQDGVSLLCRGVILARITQEAKIYARLPYSKVLYSISTGGASYDR